MATPQGATSSSVQTAAINSGVYALRSGSTATDANWRLNNINLYRLVYVGSGQVIGASDDETRGRVAAIAEMAAQTGAIVAIVGHGTGEITTAQWGVIIDTLKGYSDLQITSLADAVATIRQSPWSTSDNITYTRTWTDSSDYRLLSSSPCRNAGTNTVWSTIPNVTDFAGRKITDAAGAIIAPGLTVDIGAYEYHRTLKVGYFGFGFGFGFFR